MLNPTQSEDEYLETLDQALDYYLTSTKLDADELEVYFKVKDSMRTHFLAKYRRENKERLAYEASLKPAVDMFAAAIARDAAAKFFDASTKNGSQQYAIQEILKKHAAAATLEILTRFWK